MRAFIAIYTFIINHINRLTMYILSTLYVYVRSRKHTILIN